MQEDIVEQWFRLVCMRTRYEVQNRGRGHEFAIDPKRAKMTIQCRRLPSCVQQVQSRRSIRAIWCLLLHKEDYTSMKIQRGRFLATARPRASSHLGLGWRTGVVGEHIARAESSLSVLPILGFPLGHLRKSCVSLIVFRSMRSLCGRLASYLSRSCRLPILYL